MTKQLSKRKILKINENIVLKEGNTKFCDYVCHGEQGIHIYWSNEDFLGKNQIIIETDGETNISEEDYEE